MHASGNSNSMNTLKNRIFAVATVRTYYIGFTLNLTILHICNPTLVPASFHAASVSAAAFFTYGKEDRKGIVDIAKACELPRSKP